MKFPITNKVKTVVGTRKRSFSLDTTTHPICTDSYWNGGSKTDFQVYNLDTRCSTHPSGGTYPWNVPNDYTLQPGEVMIETGFFCGKESAPRFLCRPEDLERVKTWLGIPMITKPENLITIPAPINAGYGAGDRKGILE